MPGVQVSADDYLKPSAENLFRQLEANLMRQFRGDFSCGKALHQMIPPCTRNPEKSRSVSGL